MKVVKLQVGGECWCSKNRYVRYVIPAVPGVLSGVSCRAWDAREGDVRFHDIAPHAQYEVRVPGLIGGGS